jgi:hypothetical protein
MAQLKDIPQRMMELEKAIRALQLANNHFHETQDDAYLLLSQSQLRALICSGGSGMTPLLLDLSDQLVIPLDVSAFVYWSSMRMGYIWNCRQKSIDETTDLRISKLDAQFDALSVRAVLYVIKHI